MNRIKEYSHPLLDKIGYGMIEYNMIYDMQLHMIWNGILYVIWYQMVHDMILYDMLEYNMIYDII